MYAILLLLCAADPAILEGRVVSVHDGDTFRAIVDGQEMKVRPAWIDAPELNQPHGKESRSRTVETLLDREVRIELTGKIHLGRKLAFIYVDGRNWNEQMVSEGHAWREPRYAKGKRLEILEHDAREFRRGLWADPNPVEPWVWRASSAKSRRQSVR